MSLALTFDDGPGVSTRELLRVLSTHKCRATFFLIGENLDTPWWADSPEQPMAIAQEVVRAGHLLGNHTMTHQARLNHRELRADIEACDRAVESVYFAAGMKVPTPIPFRLPYGIRTAIAEQIENGVRRPAAALDNRLQVLASMGKTHVHWTALLPDWQARSSADAKDLANAATQHVLKMEEEGLDAVLALHDGRQRTAEDISLSREFTVEAVDLLLTEAAKRGWGTFQVPQVGA